MKTKEKSWINVQDELPEDGKIVRGLVTSTVWVHSSLDPKREFVEVQAVFFRFDGWFGAYESREKLKVFFWKPLEELPSLQDYEKP